MGDSISLVRRVYLASCSDEYPATADEVEAETAALVDVVNAAADEVIGMHEATGLVLSTAPALLALVRAARPEWVAEHGLA